MKHAQATVTPIHQGIVLNDEQQQAFDTLFEFATARTQSPMMVLGGYAGTGKTTLVAELVLALEAESVRICVCAPTHKAVNVLREKITGEGVEFATIYSLLGMRLIENDDGTVKIEQRGNMRLSDYHFVIIDECSMVNRELFKLIAQHCRNTRILFVGDPAQLAPVGEGDVSRVFTDVQHQIRLNQVVRQAAENPIIKLSMAIRAAIEAERRVTSSEIIENLPPINDGVQACAVPGDDDTMVLWATHEIREGRDARIIAFTNDAVQRYNQRLHDILRPAANYRFSVGETVIMHEGIEEVRSEKGKRDLHTSQELMFSGYSDIKADDFGLEYRDVTLKTEDEVLVFIRVAEDQRAFNTHISQLFKDGQGMKSRAKVMKVSNERDKLEYEAKNKFSAAWALKKKYANIRHVYAITAHKSQGSTFDTALIDWANLNKMKDDRDFNRGLYVAVTRPRSFLAVVM